MDTLGKITTSVIGIGISFVFLLALNVWVALAMAITTALFFAAFAAAHRVASEEAVNQQEAQNKLVGTVIELSLIHISFLQNWESACGNIQTS